MNLRPSFHPSIGLNCHWVIKKMTQNPPNQQPSAKTPPNNLSGGTDPSSAWKTWVATAASEMRLGLLDDLEPLELGFCEVEDYVMDLRLKLRSTVLKKSKNSERQIVKEAMKLKRRDEKEYHQELTKERNDWRREMKLQLGENSRSYRYVIKYLRGEARKEKEWYKTKYENKIEHLKRKYKEDEETKLDEIPDDLADYGQVSVFDRGKFNAKESEKYEITCIGEVTLSDDEKELLRLHPKFAILTDFKEVDLEWDRELGFGKLRYQLSRENEEKLDDEVQITEEEREKFEIMEGKTRQVYDPETKTFDLGKQRVTDMEDNSRVSLPT